MAGMLTAAAALWLAGTAGRWRCFQKMGCRVGVAIGVDHCFGIVQEISA